MVSFSLIAFAILWVYVQNVSTQKVWRIHIDTTEYNYTSYIVEVIRSFSPENPCDGNEGNIVWRQTVPDTKPNIVVDVPRSSLPAVSGEPVFCIQVTALEPAYGGNNSTEEDVIFRKTIRSRRNSRIRNKPESHTLEREREQTKCGQFNRDTVTLELRVDSEGKTVQGFFRTLSCDCVKELKGRYFSIYYQNNTNATDCVDTSSGKLTAINKDLLIGNVQNCSLESDALPVQPGNYCVTFTFIHKNCKGYCNTFASDMRTLYGSPPEDLTSRASTNNIQFTWYSYLPILVCIVPVIVGVVLYRKRKAIVHQSAYSPIEGHDIEELKSNAEKTAKELELTLLYFHDSDEHDEAVVTLGTFFHETWKIEKVNLDVNLEAEMSILGPSFMKLLTDARPNRRIVVVESRGAVLQEQARLAQEEYSPGNEDFFNVMFQNGLETLKTDCRRLSDYKDIFVVRFEYTTPELPLLSCVPNCRYVLPTHLFDLYCALVGVPPLTVDEVNKFRTEMNNNWKNSLESYLIPSINNCCK